MKSSSVLCIQKKSTPAINRDGSFPHRRGGLFSPENNEAKSRRYHYRLTLPDLSPVKEAAIDSESGFQVDLVDGSGALLDESPGTVFAAHVDTQTG